MLAVAVFQAKREVHIIDHLEPAITSPTQAKMRVLDVGVGGSVSGIGFFQYGSAPDGFEYLVIGHESLSEVVEIGPQVSKVKPGDLVVMTVRRPCPHASCVPCRKGRQDFCFTGDYTERGIKQQHGYMTDFVVEQECYLSVVPPGLRDVAVLVEPLTIAEKSLEQLSCIQQRLPWGDTHRAVVLGAGPVGLLGAMALRIAGFEVTVYSRSHSQSDKNEIVSAIGAQYIAAETNSVEEMAKIAGPIDVGYEAVGASGAAFEAIQHLGPNGVFIFTGVPGREGPIEVDTDYIMKDVVFNNQEILGSVNAPPHCVDAAVRALGIAMERWPPAAPPPSTTR